MGREEPSRMVHECSNEEKRRLALCLLFEYSRRAQRIRDGGGYNIRIDPACWEVRMSNL